MTIPRSATKEESRLSAKPFPQENPRLKADSSGPRRAASQPAHEWMDGEILSPEGEMAPMPMLHLLIVDDDDAVRNACSEIAQSLEFAVTTAHDMTSAREILTYQKLDLMLLDLRVRGESTASGGMTLLQEVKTLYPETFVIVMTAFATVSSAVEAMRMGAGEYLTKPFALDELAVVLIRAAERQHFHLESRRLREKMRQQRTTGHLIGRSPEMEKMFRILSKVAHSRHPVMILGESGTGKELVARAIHFNGSHAHRLFVPIDCGSLVPSMVDSELFGHVKGSFPGASRNKDGLLVSVEDGTIFLDEVADLSLELQARLLRALQEKTVRPVGGTVSVPISARILAGTSRDLGMMVEQGRFRKDLYFRLNVVNLRIPPLRTRKADIPMLTQHFLDRIQKEHGLTRSFSDEALRAMIKYDWPGNVRELEHTIERACTLSSGPTLHMGDLPTQLHEALRSPQPEQGEVYAPLPEKIVSIAEMERKTILATIHQLHGDKLMAAKLLGIGRTTLYRKLKEYGITDFD